MEDTQKKGKGSIILIFFLILIIIGLGVYIAYDKGLIVREKNIVNTEKENKEEENEKDEINYNKDGAFIQGLINSVRYLDGSSHSEDELYVKDIVTATDLSESYRNNLIYRQMVSEARADFSYGFSAEDFKNASLHLFGQDFNATPASKIFARCLEFNYSDGYYSVKPNSGGCGGAGYFYPEYTTKVETEDDDIYIYQKIAFQGPDGVYKTVVKNDSSEHQGDNFKYVDKIATYETPDDFNIENYLDKVNEYKYTFTYDKNNNVYIFKSIELVK